MLWETPIGIGRGQAENRIVFPALSPNWADRQGRSTGALQYFYETIAAGRPGMVVVAGTAVSPEGRGSDRTLCLYGDHQISGLKSLASVIRRQGCYAVLQLMHAGGQANPETTGMAPLSPSGVPCMALCNAPLTMTGDDIHRVIRDFVNAATRAAYAGFQCVELHLAHGYLLHEFLSARTNLRSDMYGGDFEGRLRLVLEIMDRIRAGIPDLDIGARLSGEDFLEKGLQASDASRLAARLEESGAAYASVTAGVYDSGKIKHQAMAQGRFFEYARVIRKAVSIPVTAVGKVLDVPTAEARLAEGCCDQVAIGRGLVADPDILVRFRRGEEPRRCLECDRCMYLRQGFEDLDCPLREFPRLERVAGK